jgi:hypothetical protein
MASKEYLQIFYASGNGQTLPGTGFLLALKANDMSLFPSR